MEHAGDDPHRPTPRTATPFYLFSFFFLVVVVVVVVVVVGTAAAADRRSVRWADKCAVV